MLCASAHGDPRTADPDSHRHPDAYSGAANPHARPDSDADGHAYAYSDSYTDRDSDGDSAAIARRWHRQGPELHGEANVRREPVDRRDDRRGGADPDHFGRPWRVPAS